MRIKYGKQTLAELSGRDGHYMVFSRITGVHHGLLVAKGETPEEATAAFEEWVRRTHPRVLEAGDPCL